MTSPSHHSHHDDSESETHNWTIKRIRDITKAKFGKRLCWYQVKTALAIYEGKDVVGCVLRRICSRTFSVRSRPFSALLSYSSLLFCPSPSPFVAPVSVLCFRPIRLILSAFHIRIRPVFSEFRPRFHITSVIGSAITPISPTPSHPVFLLFLSFIVL